MTDPEEIRCRNCDYYLGESADPLVFVEHVGRSDEATVSPPRDIRPCKGCGEKNIFIPRRELATRRQVG